jgi:tetratricopeptide (TPR) repeat protein
VNKIFLLLFFISISICVGGAFFFRSLQKHENFERKIKNSEKHNFSYVFPKAYDTLYREKKWQALIELFSARKKEELSMAEKVLLSRVQLELGLPTEALVTVEPLLATGEVNEVTRKIKAEALLGLKQYDKALDWIKYWQKKNPDSGIASYLKALCLIELDEKEASLSEFHRAIRLGLEQKKEAIQLLAATYFSLGVEASKSGRLEAAEKYLLMAVELFPGKGAFHQVLGNLYVKLKRWLEALEELDEAHSLGVEGVQATTHLLDDIYTVHHELAAVSLLEENYDKAIDYATRGLEWTTTLLGKKRLLQLRELAREKKVSALKVLARKEKDARKSLALWEKILMILPEDGEALWFVSASLPEEKKEKNRLRVFESAWGLQARRLWAGEKKEEGQLEKAFEILKEAHFLAKSGKKLKMALFLEEDIFSFLEFFPEKPKEEPWKSLYELKKSNPKMENWNLLCQKIEKKFPERYFVWIFEAESCLKAGFFEESSRLLKMMQQLDPPKKIKLRLKKLNATLKELRK